MATLSDLVLQFFSVHAGVNEMLQLLALAADAICYNKGKD